ncbi:MAG: DUF4175 domain-containing protein [Planctomycetes bacterium]|nr:DUF4175 domain-containing protein [Planctomycetota bacterium]
MSNNEMPLNDALKGLWALRRRQVLRLSVIRSLWLVFALSILVFYIDALVAISSGGRLLTVLACMLIVALTFLITLKWFSRSGDRQKMIARIIEKTNPGMDNALINAVEFSERIENGDIENASRDLMASGVSLGVSSLDEVEDFTSLSPHTLVREKKIFIGVVSVWAMSAVFFFGWFFTEVARFINPFGDHPPYSATKIEVDPGGTVVEYGNDLIVNAAVKGKIPKELTLVMREPGGDEIGEVGMYDTDDDKFFQTIENIRTEMEYFIRFKGSRSKYFRIDLAKTPRIETVMAKYKYPDYTRIEGKSRILIPGQSELIGYKDTQVTLIVESNRPLKGGMITVGTDEYPFTKADENSVQATIPLKAAGKFSIVISDVDGNLSTEKFTGDIEILKDNEPSITIVSPGMNSFAIPTAEIPVIIEAQDDLGVGKIRLFRRHNDSSDMPKTVYEELETEDYVQLSEMFDLGDLGVRPGDTIDYYATVTDTLPDSPQSAASASFKLLIISEEEYAKFMQSQMTAKDFRQKYDRIFDEMGELLEQQQVLDQQRKELEEVQAEQAAKEDADFDELKNKLADLARRQEELGKKTDEVAEKLKKESERPAIFDIEKDYKKSLAKFSEQLQKARDHMQEASKSLGKSSANPGTSSKQLSKAGDEQKKAMEALGKGTEEAREQIAKANREMEMMMDLVGDTQMFNQLYLAQQHLSRQAWSYKEVENPDFDSQLRLKELADDQQLVREGLAELKEKFRAHAEKVKEEYPKVAADASKIADDIEKRLICELMEEGRGFLDQGSGQKGYPKVEDAHQQMKAMIKFCESAGGGACKNCKFKLQLQMALNPGNTMQQMSQAMKAGMGQGTGMMGALGRGASGTGGGQSNFAMFGSETFGENKKRDSKLVSTKREKSKASPNDDPDPLAGNVEELLEEEKNTPEFEAEGDSRMMMEYRAVIEAYFKRMAEDE